MSRATEQIRLRRCERKHTPSVAPLQVVAKPFLRFARLARFAGIATANWPSRLPRST